MFIDNGNILFDDQHDQCSYFLSQSFGKAYAFVQCLDIGTGETPAKKPAVRRYWGPFDHSNPEASITQILSNGGKWPELPKPPKNLTV